MNEEMNTQLKTCTEQNDEAENDKPTAGKQGAPSALREQCPAHLGNSLPPPPRCETREALSSAGAAGTAPALKAPALKATPLKAPPLKAPPPALFDHNPVRTAPPNYKPPPPEHLRRTPATTATASWTTATTS